MLPMCVNGKCLIGVRKRYLTVLSTNTVFITFHGCMCKDVFFCFSNQTTGGTDPGTCE